MAQPRPTTIWPTRREIWLAYLDTDTWQRIRTKRIQFDKGKCQDCGRNQRLQVHHVSYQRLGAEELHDLKTLCRRCHAIVHGKVKPGKRTNRDDGRTVPCELCDRMLKNEWGLLDHMGAKHGVDVRARKAAISERKKRRRAPTPRDPKYSRSIKDW